ncbi:hypothetical protein IMZ11_02485 [Microtetraspora sp. AC03309]|uniref:hypothetical protein n=1 Tax=Microtetraspora sp. AC03309 TaxID=2779376 RepID=UPI001E4F176B|nr:hypothetical protein [Microtetraspora sp. AC03309]MCC5574506.1 hypothetical protein [Microtetraspora sp. AC03309]
MAVYEYTATCDKGHRLYVRLCTNLGMPEAAHCFCGRSAHITLGFGGSRDLL